MQKSANQIKELHQWNKVLIFIYRILKSKKYYLIKIVLSYICSFIYFQLLNAVNFLQFSNHLPLQFKIYTLNFHKVQVFMISCHLNKKKILFQPKEQTKTHLFNIKLSQKSLTNYWDKVRHTDLKKQLQVSRNSTNQNKSNDQNCSYQANTFSTPNQSKQNSSKNQNQEFSKVYQKIQPSQGEKPQIPQNANNYRSQVVNLKKKIKKCNKNQHCLKFTKQDSFSRQKIRFTRKIYKAKRQNSSQEDIVEGDIDKEKCKVQMQQEFLQYPVFKDSEIFPGRRCEQFRNQIVNQRIDNDVQTDDEQIQKFLKKITREFIDHIEAVNKQNRQHQEHICFESESN